MFLFSPKTDKNPFLPTIGKRITAGGKNSLENNPLELLIAATFCVAFVKGLAVCKVFEVCYHI